MKKLAIIILFLIFCLNENAEAAYSIIRPIPSFARASIAFLNNTQYDANVPRTQSVLLVSTSDGAIPAAEGEDGEHIIPYCVTSGYIFGAGVTSGLLYKSPDGITWTRTAYATAKAISTIFATSTGMLLLADTENSKIYWSDDLGDNFTQSTITMNTDSWVWGNRCIAEHNGVLMLIEYGAAGAGRYIHSSMDDGKTWTQVFDGTTLTPAPDHFHAVGYHTGTGKWVVGTGDGLAKQVIITSTDGNSWTQLYDVNNSVACFYDTGDSSRLLFGADSASTIAWLDVNTGAIVGVFDKSDRRASRFACLSITKYNGVYYACSMDTSGGTTNAVIWVSNDLVHWSVYHRFAANETQGVLSYAGYIGGKLHFETEGISDVNQRRHFAISPAKVRLVTGTFLTPAVTNLMNTVNLSSFEDSATWTTWSSNWTITRDANAAYIGSYGIASVGIDEAAAERVTYTTATLTSGTTYIYKIRAKASRQVIVLLCLYKDGDGILQTSYYNLDTEWKDLISMPYTATSTGTYAVILYVQQGTKARTVYIDAFQLKTLASPLTEWQVGGTPQAADISNSTMTSPAEWTDLFAIQTIGLTEQYGLAAAQYIKTWKFNLSNYVYLYYNGADAKFYIRRKVNNVFQTAVGTTAQYWNPNALLKFAFQSSATGISLTIQNGRATETITDGAIAAINSATVIMTHGNIVSDSPDYTVSGTIEPNAAKGDYSVAGDWETGSYYANANGYKIYYDSDWSLWVICPDVPYSSGASWKGNEIVGNYTASDSPATGTAEVSVYSSAPLTGVFPGIYVDDDIDNFMVFSGILTPSKIDSLWNGGSVNSVPVNLAGDLNDDCKVDFRDFAIMAENWLIDCDANPSNPACVPK